MIAELIVASEAEGDLNEYYGWHETHRVGLGEEFLSKVDACVSFIRRMPEMHEVVVGSFRRALVRRFPFAIFYEYDGKTVTIYGVFHTSLDPKKWQQRLIK